MKKIVILLLLACVASFASAQKIKESEVPASVLKMYHMKMADTLPAKWERNDTYYTALFKRNKLKGSMVFSENAEWYWTRWEIPSQYIPKKVKAYLTENYADGKISKTIIEYKAGNEKSGNEYYLIQIKQKKEVKTLRFSINGDFIGIEEQQGDNKTKADNMPGTQEK